MRKWCLGYGVLLVMLGMLTACSHNVTTYTYDNEDVVGVEIDKMKVYPDKLVIHFAEDSLSEVEEVTCYRADFSIVEEQPQFSFRGSTLTIETEHADTISGIRVKENEYMYFDVRYLDSDSYAMLVCSWADDVGYMTEGDKVAYYTEEEKEEQKARAAALAEEEKALYDKLLGLWINESETVRVEFLYNQSSDEKSFVVYECIDDEWKESDQVNVTTVTEEEAYQSVEITLYDNPYWGAAYYFYLCNDGSGMECSYSDEKFVKVK